MLKEEEFMMGKGYNGTHYRKGKKGRSRKFTCRGFASHLSRHSKSFSFHSSQEYEKVSQMLFAALFQVFFYVYFNHGQQTPQLSQLKAKKLFQGRNMFFELRNDELCGSNNCGKLFDFYLLTLLFTP